MKLSKVILKKKACEFNFIQYLNKQTDVSLSSRLSVS
jgi:hypothetical protein